MSIYVDFEKPESYNLKISEFIAKLFSVKYSLSSESFQLKNVKTYYDKECISIQCSENKYRSFDDLFEIINTYYPNTSPKDLLHELLSINLYYAGVKMYLFASVCSDISRITLFFYKGIRDDSDIFDINYHRYDSKYSWKELFNMLNINNKKELIKYIEENRILNPIIDLKPLELNVSN